MSAFLQPFVSRLALGLGCLLLLAAGAAHAQSDEPPGRVGRLANLEGTVWLFDTELGQWAEALRNRALTSGDRLSTDPGARAEVRVGSTELRLDAGTEVEFVRLDDERMVFQLHGGSLALRVRSREIAREVEVRTAEGRLLPERSGHYRVDRVDDTTYAVAWRGSLRFEAPDTQVQVLPGRRAEFFQLPQDRTTVVSWAAPENDAFSDWVARDEQRDDRSASQRYVSPEMTGAEDLDRYGRWERHPEYGMLWAPFDVAVGWAPYRHGRWTWQVRWGWTWVDDARWGFAPFHYGRWVSWHGRWYWSPGAYVARPVFAPALVAWVGGPSLSVSINFGSPVVGWVPLAPRDVYVPAFPYGPRYYRNVNRPHHPHAPPAPRQVPTGPVMYGNRGVPGAVTVVPSNVLRQRQPVAAAAVQDVELQRAVSAGPFRPDTPIAPPTRVIAVPGGAQPVVVPPAPGRAVELRRERTLPAAPPMPVQTVPRAEVRTPPAGPPVPVTQAPRADAPAPRATAPNPPTAHSAPDAPRTPRPPPPKAAPRPETPGASGGTPMPASRAPRAVPPVAPGAAPPVAAKAPPAAAVPTGPKATPAPQAAPAREPRAQKGRDELRDDPAAGRSRTPESRPSQRERQNTM